MIQRRSPNSANGRPEKRLSGHRPEPEAVRYGSSVVPEEAFALTQEPLVTPDHNKSFIQSVAKTKGASGEVEVRKYHESRFAEQNAELLSKCLHLESQANAEQEGIQRQIDEVSKIHARSRRYQEQSAEDNTPWTTFDQVEVTVLVIFALLLLGVGINTTGQVLHATGIPGFESLWRCYLFSFIPVGLALLFKSFSRIFNQPESRRRYTICVWIGGLIFGTCWVLAFARTFPAFSQSTADIINSLSINTTNAQSNDSSADLGVVVFSIFAEALLSAGCFLTIQRIVEKHEPSKRVTNPAHERTQLELDRWMNRLYQQKRVLAAIQGKISRIEEAKRLFGDEAVNYFRLALSSEAQDQKVNTLFQS